MRLRIVGTAIVLGFVSGALEALEVSRLFEAFSQGGAEVLRIELPIGNLRIREARDRLVDAELILSCTGLIDPCREAAEGMRFGSAESGVGQLLSFGGPGSFEKRVKSFTNGSARAGWKLSADLQVAVPPYERLELTLGDGDLTLERLHGAARIRVHSGAVQLRATRSAVGRVEIEVRKGRARLDGTGVRSIEGKKVRWQGPGNDALDIGVVRGSVLVSLD